MDSVLSTALIVLTDEEQQLVSKLLAALHETDAEIYRSVLHRLDDLEGLVPPIAHFPSLLENRVVLGEKRSRGSIIEALMIPRDGDRMLHLPSKAVLGKGFLVAKYHTFKLFTQVAAKAQMPEKDVAALEQATSTLMFTVMAEDVYLNLLDSLKLPEEIQRQVALMLIILWEHRSDLFVKDTAPVLQAVWDARQSLIPAYGSMMGVSELVLLSMNIDGDAATWTKFIKERLQDRNVTMALEEFLMDMSWEQIEGLRERLRDKKITAINRDEVAAFLREIENSEGAAPDERRELEEHRDNDLSDFYMKYTVRRDNARVRKRLGIPGPKNTLEDHYMAFALVHFDQMRFNKVLLGSKT